MIKNKKIICLIVAKKNSTGLKNKNILPLAGKPLIHWTFRAAKKSKFIDQIILSTDSKLIIKRLKEASVFVSNRAGSIRFSPHLYNTCEDIDIVLREIDSIMTNQ